jgi:hypothetical protein
MRAVAGVLRVFFVIFLLVWAGCQSLLKNPDITTKTDNDFNKLSIYARYAPTKINIMPLTEFVRTGIGRQAKINLYVSLLDSFGSQIKSPCVFRFELYQRVQRSAEPKGKREIIWPDIDLSDPDENNQYWRDFLRAYEFNLPFEPATNQGYILQVTCMCPSEKRLSAEFALKFTE